MRVLNVGGCSKEIPIPKCFLGWEHHLLDINPVGNPDICCDAMTLKNMTDFRGQYDSVLCSHNLEHYYRHKVPDVLTGFKMVLTDDGFCLIRVPHVMNALYHMVKSGMTLDDKLYDSPAGPITTFDMLFGFQQQVRESGEDFFAHKTAFSPKSLADALLLAGFGFVKTIEKRLDLIALAFKKRPADAVLEKLSSRVYPEGQMV